MKSSPILNYPNRMWRIILLAMEEILGRKGVNAVLHLEHLPDDIDQTPPSNQDLKFIFELAGRIQTALECAYGTRAGRGLSIRVGRACVKYGLREFGSELGITDLSFRLLPLQTRLKVVSEALAKLFNQFPDLSVHLELDNKYIYCHIERSPQCWERQAEGPYYALAVGFLQEALYWVSGGKYFLVEEKKRITFGESECTIVIDQTPMS